MGTDPTTPTGRSDAALVAAITGGDPGAWGELFDRHRDVVWQVAHSVVRNRAEADDVLQATFLSAVESVGQLRDPARLRPWLLSIARRRALDIVRRRREIAHDPTDPSTTPFETIPDEDDDSLIAGLRDAELRELVTDAFDGLEPRDRVALELAERQGLSGDELAEILEVTRDNAYALVHNAKDRLGASVSSLVVARLGRDACPDLDGVLADWDGELTPLVRKRVNRHITQCSTCGETRRLQVSPAALLALLPVVVISTQAADQSRAVALEAATGGGSSTLATGALTTKSLVLKVVAGIAVVAGIGVAVTRSSTDGGQADSVAQRAVASTTSSVSTTTSISVATSTTTSMTSTTSTTTTLVVPVEATYCDVAGQLFDVASPGPAAAGGIEAYIRSVNDLVQVLAITAGDAISPELEAYALAYSEAVAAGVWDPAEMEDGAQLAALGDAVAAEINAACGIGNG